MGSSGNAEYMGSLRFLFRYLVHSANHACAAQSLGKTLCAALRFMTPSGLLVKFGNQALRAVQSHIFSNVVLSLQGIHYKLKTENQEGKPHVIEEFFCGSDRQSLPMYSALI